MSGFNQKFFTMATIAVVACSCSEDSAPANVPAEFQAPVSSFKQKAVTNREIEWKAISDPFKQRLGSTSREKIAITRLCNAWLGSADPPALKKARDAIDSPLNSKPIKDDVLVYQLSNSNGFETVLVVDFRDVNKPHVGELISNNPPEIENAHDRISAEERRIAKNLRATEINLGGGSLSGNAKSGFWVRLEGAAITPQAMNELVRLNTLVSLEVNGREFDDNLLRTISIHPYLAGLDLNGTTVSEAGFLTLSNASSLKFLTANGSAISADTVKKLQSFLPHLAIEIGKESYSTPSKAKPE